MATTYNREEMLAAMREQRGQLEREIAAKTAELSQLTGAINALEGSGPKDDTPDASTLVWQCVMALKTLNKAEVFHYDALRLQASREFEGDPRKLHKFKVGLYNAIATLLKKQKLRKVPGGFQIVG